LTDASWEAVAPITNQMKLHALCFSLSRVGISAPPHALRIAPPDDTAIPEGVAEFLKLHPQVKKIAIAGETQETVGMEIFARLARDLGLDVVVTTVSQSRASDLSPDATKIRDANPDALFVSAPTPTSLPLLKELEAQGFDKPILLNGQVWAGADFIHGVGAAGQKAFTIGFATNEPDPANAKYNAYVKRFLDGVRTTSLPQPVNVCNTTLAYDSVFLLADIMRKAGVDGTMMTNTARELIKAGLDGLKDYQGFNKITLRDTSDGHVKCHLLKANIRTKQWEYALARDQRIKTPAPFKARG
jgi:ABC-type branched-subunit amino acid transport system substrate-binding protein